MAEVYQQGNYPQSMAEEFDKCRDFLRNYADGVEIRPYLVQLVGSSGSLSHILVLILLYITQTNASPPDQPPLDPLCTLYHLPVASNHIFLCSNELKQDIKNRYRKQLEIDCDDIFEYKRDEDFMNNVKRNSMRYVQFFEKAATEILEGMVADAADVMAKQDVFDIIYEQRKATLIKAAQQDENNPNGEIPEVDVPKCLTRRFEVCIHPTGRDKRNPRKLRDVRAADIGHLVCVRGMVTRATDVKPRVTVCTYVCDNCGSEVYQPVFGQEFNPYQECPAPRCKDAKSVGQVVMQGRGTRFVKYQELRVQELPDQVPVGHIPRSISVHCKGEQTRQCVPGDIINISGVFLAQRFTGFKGIKAGLLSSTYLEANVIDKERQSYAQMDDEIEMKEMDDIFNSPNTYERLASSIAPEIFGHTDVKKALLLQLVGGTTRELNDGMKIRGDINICLMGDPGVAKSQLLKYISSVAPRGVYTTGKGSSGVGLTAAVVKDTLTGDLSLEGGALVLADMGICCIDEFDKMDESDRTAIHEVMEQQTISIAKAGITTTLNARAAVLAAANPLNGRYNKRRSISENVDLPNSLLSRFDLMFLLLDKADMTHDLALAKHVLHVHRFKKNPEMSFEPLRPTAVKHFVSLARKCKPFVPPQLTEYIVEQYVDMRSKDASSTGHGYRRSGQTDQAVMTARQLLSILRLGQALARLRLASEICAEDIDEALRLTKASKSSLEDDTRSLQQEDPVSAIYTIMREAAENRGVATVNYNDVEAMVVMKGFSNKQLKECILEYQSLGVLSVDESWTKVTFDDA